MAKIRILIADDHALVRQGIAAMLSFHEEVEVAGEAANGAEAVEKTLLLGPDVVLMDVAMPGLGGMEATTRILALRPETKILVLSQYSDREYVARFLKAGVKGYILKTADASELISAVRAVARGDSYLQPQVAGAVIEGFLGAGKESDPYGRLTDREKEVLKLLAEGASQKEIAAALGISPKTVGAHQGAIHEKLGVHSKGELIKFAIRQGIIKLG
jgi:DNA-binding NarL/FixJ family response regulator